MSRKTYCLAAIFIALVLASVALAAPAGVSNVENFIRSVIQVVAGLAGLVATDFLLLAVLPIPLSREILSSSTKRNSLSRGRQLVWRLSLRRLFWRIS